MQHSTVIHSGRRFSGFSVLGAILALITIAIVLFALWQSTRPVTPAPTPVAPAEVVRPANPAFADEAAYVATVNEYLNSGLDESYLPLPAPAAIVAPPAANPAFADEAAYVATVNEYLNSGLDESYLPLPAPAAIVAPPAANPAFADEAAYVATVNEYLNSGLDESYLPLPAPAASRPAQVNNRFFADEVAGAAQGSVTLATPANLEPATPLGGPR